MRRVFWWILLVMLLTGPSMAQEELDGLVLIIDPGHGDRAWGGVPADPGATAGAHKECIYTWDTAMRLKRLAEAKGAMVYLTLQSSGEDTAPRLWSEDELEQWNFKRLLDEPEPASEYEALLSRVQTANRIYLKYALTHDVVFLSLHFDSTNPDLAGVSFYYPTWCETEPRLLKPLLAELRQKDRARKSLSTGKEYSVAAPAMYAVLSQAYNPESYLVELVVCLILNLGLSPRSIDYEDHRFSFKYGPVLALETMASYSCLSTTPLKLILDRPLANMRSRKSNGANPDLWRMRSAEVREEYAEILIAALQARPARDPLEPKSRSSVVLLLVLLLILISVRRRYSL